MNGIKLEFKKDDMKELFTSFKSITGINQTGLSKISGIPRETINRTINKNKEVSRMLNDSVRFWMVKELRNFQKEQYTMLNKIMEEIEKGVYDNEQ